jgi:hypothetical protein
MFDLIARGGKVVVKSDTKLYKPLTALMPALTNHAAPTERPRKAGWQKATFTDLSEAEDLLDRLENTGYAERKLSIDGGSFVVRWRLIPYNDGFVG